MKSKKCSNIECRKVKPISDFYTNKASPDGIDYRCKECRKCASRNISESYKRKRSVYMAKYRRENAEDLSAYNRKYLHKWYQENREKALRDTNAYTRQRHRSDPQFRLKRNLRRRLHNALNGKTKSKPTLDLIGCSVEELMRRLERKFSKGMTWENYGPVWHLDHIKPMALFDLSNNTELEMCCHYSNLQPLFKEDNIRKSDRYKG